ncbi:inverse autotransporter beta domain-containing protein, partial [Bartonella sp. LJL80]
FDQVKAGDTVYVPIAPVSDEMARYLEGDASQNGAITSLASQAGNFLSNGGHGSELQSMATGYFSGKANSAINQWFNQFGTARIQLNVDDGFSLKNSQFEMLLPIYDKGNNLVFTQTAIHRTDERTQTNLGFGYRYFAPDYMIGGNAFWDYDISRSHSRMGVGLEYWRDYLKLGVNGYYRLSDWRVSPDVEDYLERPANGWDIRAEGYLPSYPQLGMKLNFEQYYGDEVGLFGKSSRQKNPYAVTIGANYTPIPLLTLNVDHRQGESGNNDTRLGFQVNYRFGVPLAKQLDPNAVDDMRTLAGSRYDLVDRNNNIVLEYKKQEVIKLYMVGGITGFYNESHSLGITVESKHNVASVSVMAAALIAAGGKIVQGSGVSDYSVVLPPYQQGGNN